MDNEPKKHEFLYRGVVIGYNDLKDFKFFGVDLKPYKAPLIDDQGRQTVEDGNEYGLYMTDNKSMVYSAYGSVHNGGTKINSSIQIGFPPTSISIPNIGISYKISTKKIEMRKPWIVSHLTGHYNNGFKGDEYITDVVPSGEYEISRIEIGSDFLHASEELDVSDIKKAEEELKNKMDMRKYRLELFVDTISKMPAPKRAQIGEFERAAFRDIFGENGVRYIDRNSIDVSNPSGVIKYLISVYYNNSQSDIDFKNLVYIESVKNRLLRSDNPQSIDTIVSIISTDIDDNLLKRTNFIDRKKSEGVEIKTDSFDARNQMYKNMLTQISNLSINPNQVLNQSVQPIYPVFDVEAPMAR